jgi:hypothetical protein
MRQIAIASAICTVVLSGCLPFAHHEPDIPKVEGFVFSGGQPVKGAEIFIIHRFNPTVETKVTTTDQNGHFYYSGSERLLPFVVLGDPGYEFALRIALRGRSYTGHSEHGLGYAPDPMFFSCDLRAQGNAICSMQPLLPNNSFKPKPLRGSA